MLHSLFSVASVFEVKLPRFQHDSAYLIRIIAQLVMRPPFFILRRCLKRFHKKLLWLLFALLAILLRVVDRFLYGALL